MPNSTTITAATPKPATHMPPRQVRDRAVPKTAVSTATTPSTNITAKPPHVEKIVEIYVGFVDKLAFVIRAQARRAEEHDCECYEEHCENKAVDEHFAAHTCCKVFVAADIVDEIHGAHGACKEEYRYAEQKVFQHAIASRRVWEPTAR